MENTLIMPSRGCVAPNYFLMTPANFVANALPFFNRTVVVLLTTPRDTAARFGQYLLKFDPSGGTTRAQGAGFENFLYQVEGEVALEQQGETRTLVAGDYCYLPTGVEFSLRAPEAVPATTLWTKRPYEEISGIPLPPVIFGRVPMLRTSFRRHPAPTPTGSCFPPRIPRSTSP